MDSTRTRETPGPRLPRPRKIRLDCEVYRPHSVRASCGDADCDHDFEIAPTVKQDDFAVWNCTRCGREFKYEIWSPNPKATPPTLTEPRRHSAARNGHRHS
jgi:hypothetical protein